MRSIVVLSVIVSCVQAFYLPKINSKSFILRDEEQNVKDLNLEEMFEVFDSADKTVSSSEIPKGQPGSKFVAKNQVGSSAPFGFFDPAGFSNDVTEEQFKLYQEAEIKHGRVSMLAFLGLLAGEVFPHPFFGGAITGPAIYQFQQTYGSAFPAFWIFLVAAIGAIEAKSIATNWIPLGETLKEPSGLAKLKGTAVPGDLQFDPLGFLPKNADAAAAIRTKELNNGRLAMIGTAGIVAQELVSGNSVF